MRTQVTTDDLLDCGDHERAGGPRRGVDVQPQMGPLPPMPLEIGPHPVLAETGEQRPHRIQEQTVLVLVVVNLDARPVPHVSTPSSASTAVVRTARYRK